MLFPTETGDRLLANMRSGKPSLCAYVFSHYSISSYTKPRLCLLAIHECAAATNVMPDVVGVLRCPQSTLNAYWRC
jgi:hypothetical protein